MTLGEWLDAVIRTDEPSAGRNQTGRRQESARNDDRDYRQRPRRFDSEQRDDREFRSSERRPPRRDDRSAARIDRGTEEALGAVEQWIRESDGRRAREDERLNQALDMVTQRLDSLDERMSDGGREEFSAIRDMMERLENRIEDVALAARKDSHRGNDRFQNELEKRVGDIARRLEEISRNQANSGTSGTARLERLESMLEKVAGSLEDRQRAMTERPVLNGPRRRADLLSSSAAMADIRAHKLRLEQTASQPAALPMHAIGEQIEKAQERVLARVAPAFDTIRAEIAKLAGQVSEVRQNHPQDDLRDELSALRSTVAKVAGQMSDVRQLPPQDEIRDELSALRSMVAHVAGQMAEARQQTPQDDLRVELSDLRSVVGKVAAQLSEERHIPPQDDVLDELSALRSMVAKVAEAKPEPPPVMPMIPEVLDEISVRMRQEFAAISHAVNERLDASAQQDQVSPKLAQLLPALDSLSQRMETVGSRMATDLRRDFQTAITDLRQAIAQQRPAVTLEPIEKAIQDLSGRIGSLSSQPGVDSAVLVRTNLELAEMRELIGKLANPLALDRIEKQVDALAKRLDDLSNSASRTDIEALSKELRHLARQFDPALALTAMDDKLRALEERIGHRFAGQATAISGDILNSDISGLERMIGSLSQKIDAARAPEAGIHQLDALQHQIAQIAQRLERSDEGIIALGSIERAVSDLFTQIDSLRQAQHETAEIAARRAAEYLAQDLPLRTAESSAFAGDAFSSMLQARETVDVRTQQTLTAVHETLEKIVGRLGTLEQEVIARGNKPAEGLPVRAAIEAATLAAHDMAKPAGRPMESRIAAASRPVEQAAAAAAQAAIDVNVLNAPGKRRAKPIVAEPETKSSRFSLKLPFMKGKIESAVPGNDINKPESIAAQGVVKPRKTVEGDIPLEPGSGRPGSEAEAGARLVAAARRAAQTAVSETETAKSGQQGEALAEPRSAKANETAESGTESFLAKRKKPILLGLAAIAIAALSINVLSSLLSPPTGGMGKPAIDASAPVSQKKAASDRVAPETDGMPKQAALPVQTPADPPSVGSLMEAGKPLNITPGSSIMNPEPLNPPAREQAKEAVKDFQKDPAAATPVAALAPGELPAGITSPGLKNAVQRGDITALYEVGNRLFEGRGVPRDPKLAMSWFERAGNAGLVPAQFRVGNMYEKGIGVARDLKQARQWYGRAADKGNAKAIHNLGVIIAEGGDGKPDYAVAADLFRRAAQFGIRDSQYNIAILLARGLGVGQNMSEAYTWFAIAAAQGDDEAGRKRDEVAARLSPEDLLAAKEAVKEFKPLPQDAIANDVPDRMWDAPAGPSAKPKTSNRATGTTRL